MTARTAFFAYPEASALVRDAVRGATENVISSGLTVKLWQNMNILGFKLDNLVRESIDEADFLAADITYPNHNVFYEIGYAMARGKPVLPTVNTAIASASDGIRRIGLFDTTGYAGYNNSNELNEKLGEWEAGSWKNNHLLKRNFAQPLFILDTLKKTDFRSWIFHAVEESEVNCRVFDPAEVPRLTAAQAISEVSSSSGVIIPLLSPEIVDSEMHNLRAGFILGLAHGFGLDALVIQYENSPAPLDYRDFVKNSASRIETLRHVSEYCQDTLIRNQKPENRASAHKNSILSSIDLGYHQQKTNPATWTSTLLKLRNMPGLCVQRVLLSPAERGRESLLYICKFWSITARLDRSGAWLICAPRRMILARCEKRS